MKFYITGLLFGSIFGGELLISIILFCCIWKGRYGDEDLFLGKIFSTIIGGFFGAVLGLMLVFFLTRSETIIRKYILVSMLAILLLVITCRIYLGMKVLPPLVSAARSNDIFCLRASINLHANLDKRDINGTTALIKASERGHSDFVALLIQEKANLNLKDRRGHSALMSAIEQEHFKVASILIESGADVNIQNNSGQTALIIASSSRGSSTSGELNIVQQLIKSGADINIKDNFDKDAITYASELGHAEIIRALIEAGAKM